jgi:hypothetical protein
VIYNRTNNLTRAAGLRIELLNTNDNVCVSSSEISSGKLYYRFDGDRIGDATLSTSESTTAIINNSSNTETLTEVADLSTLSHLFSKVRVIRTSNADYTQIREMQMFINGDNKLIETKPLNSLFNTMGEFNSSYLVENMNDGNLGLYILFHSANSAIGTAIGGNVGVNLNSYFSKYDIESVVIYNRTNNLTRAAGLRIELLNTNDNVCVSSSEISFGTGYYRFDGDRIGDATLSSSESTTAIINNSSNTETLTEVADLSTLDYLFSKVRVIRTSNANTTHLKEMQMFINGDNKLVKTKPLNSLFNTMGEFNSSPLENIIDGELNNFFISSNAAIGGNAGVNLNSYFSKYDIESVVIYNFDAYASYYFKAIGLRIDLLNANDTARVNSSIIQFGNYYYRFDGPRIGNATLSTSESTTAIINSPGNTESLTGL